MRCDGRFTVSMIAALLLSGISSAAEKSTFSGDATKTALPLRKVQYPTRTVSTCGRWVIIRGSPTAPPQYVPYPVQGPQGSPGPAGVSAAPMMMAAPAPSGPDPATVAFLQQILANQTAQLALLHQMAARPLMTAPAPVPAAPTPPPCAGGPNILVLPGDGSGGITVPIPNPAPAPGPVQPPPLTAPGPGVAPPIVIPPGGGPPIVIPPGGGPPIVLPPGGAPPVVIPPGGGPPIGIPPGGSAPKMPAAGPEVGSLAPPAGYQTYTSYRAYRVYVPRTRAYYWVYVPPRRALPVYVMPITVQIGR